MRFWRRDAGAFKPVLERRTIAVKDVDGRARGRDRAATTDIAAAVTGAALIVIPLPATAQAGLFAALAPLLSRRPGGIPAAGHLRQLPHGKASCAKPATRAAVTGRNRHAALAGAQARAAEVAISVRATRLPTGVYPGHATATHALAVIRRPSQRVEACGDALSGALMNAGPIIHPPLMVMNAGAAAAFRALGHPQRRHAALGARA